MPIFIFCFGILFSKMPFENLMLFFVYPNKCQTLWYETILHNKQNNKKYLSPPFFSSICTIGHNLGVTKAKKMRFCPPKKTTEFLSEKTEASSRDVLLSTGKKWKIERETKVVIQSGLRLKLAFEVFWKFSCLFWHPLLSLSNAGVKRKSFVTHRWFKISLIELLDPRGYVMHSLCRNFCTENALCFPSKCASESCCSSSSVLLLFFNERKTPS